MTKEEAIKVLKDLRIFDDDREEDCEAIDLGISALEKQIKLNEIGFTEEVIENYKIFEDECITKGFTFKSLLDARDRQINGGWIPCSERQPDKTDNYLAYCESGDGTATLKFINVEHYNSGNDWTGFYKLQKMRREVIAWQNLPTPYQESEAL